MDTSVIARITASRQRLEALLNGLSEDDFARPVGPDWTVKAALAHIAFWDQRALTVLKRWLHTGQGGSPIDVEAVNDALLPLTLAIPPAEMARLVRDSATAIDRLVEQLTPEQVAALDGDGGKFNIYLNRANHRTGHLDEIDQALGRS